MIEVTVLELPPVHQNDGGSRPTLGLRKGETVRLTCAMIAGLEDTLVWLYNGNVLPTINTSTSSKVVVNSLGGTYQSVYHSCIIIFKNTAI